jgi:hypothetical protein
MSHLELRRLLLLLLLGPLQACEEGEGEGEEKEVKALERRTLETFS